MLGTPIGGICGFDLFARCVVSVDFPKCEIALFNPKQYALSQGHWGEFVFTGRTPAVRGTFEGGRTGLFMIDTGASRAVTFHTSFREELAPLIERATGRAVSTGIGGSQSAVTGTLAWLSLGEHRFENVDASYSLATEGDFTDSYTIGTIGSRLFDNRAVIFHYADQKLAIVPSRKE